MLIISGRRGKLYVNEYTYQEFLRDGLPAVISLLMTPGSFNDCLDGLLIS
ncbi:MAG: hypothetical protein ABI472_06500 [Ginsengibacter sp.]